ncbi:MAG TPA: Ig-like domain-containing protein [Nevskiaceae bacterium]|nr:Ig-like domain-containing protein [Nevskiaceae bacterium]
MRRAGIPSAALLLATLASIGAANAAPGTLDLTFDTTVDGGSAEEKALDVAVGASGRVYVLDQVGEASYKVLRFKADGSLDTAFGSGGGIAFSAVNNLFTGVESFLALAVDETNKVLYVGGGYGTLSGGARMLVKKLAFSGTFDSNYGNNGRALLNTPGDGAVVRLALQGTKLLLAGVDGTLGTDDEGEFTILGTSPYVGRLLAGGGVDGTFTPTAIDWGTSEEAPTGITVESTGTLLVTGITGLVAARRAGTGSALARLSANGGLDDGFGTGGLFTRDFAAGACTGAPTDEVCETTGLHYPQADGSFLVSIYLDRPDTANDRILIQRFTAGGARSGAPLSYPADDYLADGTPVVAAEGHVVVAEATPTDLRVYRIEGYSVVGQPNHAPVAANDRFTVAVSSTGNRLKPMRNDTDVDGDVLTLVRTTLPAHGTARLNAAKTLVVYTPTPGFAGKDSFKYTISDGRGGRSTATITVTVAP